MKITPEFSSGKKRVGLQNNCDISGNRSGGNLTLQPFQPKLRLSKHMQANARHIRILALLLGVVFLGAQFHFCADLTASPSASHICPVCSTAASVVATQSPVIAMVPVTNRLELTSLVISVFSAVPRATAPRAPPAR
jgi:hypothetical protein